MTVVIRVAQYLDVSVTVESLSDGALQQAAEQAREVFRGSPERLLNLRTELRGALKED